MEQKTINLTANNQSLTIEEVLEFASDPVGYIHAVFDLGDNWDGFDQVRAIWVNGVSVPTVLNSLGECNVPWEVVDHIGVVKVSLVGCIVENDVLTERLTTYQIPSIVVKQNVPICDSESQPITPSQFEQFCARVKNDADRAEQAVDDAEGQADRSETEADRATTEADRAETEADNALASAQNAHASELNAEAYKNQAQLSAESASASATDAEEWADKAEQSAEDAGYMEFHIDDNGHLIFERTSNVNQINFELVNGHLILEVA